MNGDFESWFKEKYPHLDIGNIMAEQSALDRFQKKFAERDKYKAYRKTDKCKAYRKTDKYKAYHKAYYQKNKERIWGVGARA